MRNASFYGRWVGFVEIMAPGFSRAALERLLPTLELSQSGCGLGPRLRLAEAARLPERRGHRRNAVVHTRPVGQMRDAELAARVLAESGASLAAYDCRQMHSTFGAFGPDLERLDLAPERLLAELVRGWQYLIDRDPRVLAWIRLHQHRHFEWPEYPVAGTP